MIIQREIQNKIIDWLNTFTVSNKVIVIYGARQVGKTTLIKQIQNLTSLKSAYYNCDYLNVQELFAYNNAHNFDAIVKDIELLILDEAQRIFNIGIVLKILTDTFPSLKIIATGSSSFELANKINEPLTGRKTLFTLFPFSFHEATSNLNYAEQKASIEKLLRFGSYPALHDKNEDTIIQIINELTGSYLFKDILSFQNLRKPELLNNLLRLLAFQVGNEVSYSELAMKLKVDQTVIQKYIYLLEESFIIYKLQALSRNLRNEVIKTRKIYFWDLGIRNSLIQNFNPLNYRNDVGQLWENFCVTERLKYLKNRQISFNSYFWRTYSQKEIDYIEEKAGQIKAYEFKFNPDKQVKIPNDFLKGYPGTEFKIINQDNFINELFTEN